MLETLVGSLGWEDPLEKKMAAHSSILAWKVPRMEDPWDRKESDKTERIHFHFPALQADSLPAEQPGRLFLRLTNGTYYSKSML